MVPKMHFLFHILFPTQFMDVVHEHWQIESQFMVLYPYHYINIRGRPVVDSYEKKPRRCVVNLVPPPRFPSLFLLLSFLLLRCRCQLLKPRRRPQLQHRHPLLRPLFPCLQSLLFQLLSP